MTKKTWKRYVYLDAKRVRLTITADDEDGPSDDWECLSVTVDVELPVGFEVVFESSHGTYTHIEAQRDRRATPTEKPVVVDVGDGVQILREV